MTDDPRVEELLEELLDSGGTPEEVCRACPELLTQVRAGWQHLRALEAEVGALFPESTSVDGAGPSALPPSRGYDVQGVLGRGGMGVVLLALESHMSAEGKGMDPVPFLKRIQEAHPGDFWVNLRLANALTRNGNHGEAIRYYQAALAVRPNPAFVYTPRSRAVE